MPINKNTKGKDMIQGIDHVVIAVKDIDAAVSRYEALYGTKVTERRDSEAMGLKVAIFRFPDSTYVELVSNLGDKGPVAKRLAEQGEGVHLVAMKVDDIDKTVTELRDKGTRLVGDPGPGKPITGQVFIHPSVTRGVLTQLFVRK